MDGVNVQQELTYRSIGSQGVVCRYIYYIHTAGIFTHCRHWPGKHHTGHCVTLVSMVTVAIPGTIATFLRNLINDHYTLCQAMYDITNVQNAIMEKFT